MHAIVERLRQHTAGQKLRPPLSEAGITEAETSLGFQLPSLLREIYGIVADGGFGPPYGFLPLLTPLPDTKLPNLSLAGCDSVVTSTQFSEAETPKIPRGLGQSVFFQFWSGVAQFGRALTVHQWNCGLSAANRLVCLQNPQALSDG